MNSIKSIVSRVTTLPKAIKALENVGVSVNKANGEQKDAYDILGELAGKWSTLSAEQQRNTAIQVAGTYQVTRLNALLQNWQIGLNATQSALNSSGSAMTENEKYMASLQARIEKMKTAWDTLTLAFGDAVISDSIRIITALLGAMSNVFTPLVKTIGGLPVAFGVLAGSITFVAVAFRGMVVSVAQTIASLLGITTTVTTTSIAMGVLSASINLAKVAWRGLLAATGVGLAFVAIGFILEKLINAFGDTNNAIDETADSMDKLKETTGNLNELRAMSEEYDSLSKKTKLTAEEKNRLALIETNLASKQNIVMSSATNQTQAYNENAEAIKNRITLLEQQAETERRIASDAYRTNSVDIGNSISSNVDKIEELSKKAQEAEKALSDFQIRANSGDAEASGFTAEEVKRKLDNLNLTYKESSDELNKVLIEQQQNINKRSAALRGEFERQEQVYEEGGSKINEAVRRYVNVYADIVASSKNTNDLDFTKNFTSVLTEMNSRNFKDSNQLIEYFQSLNPEIKLTSDQLQGLQDAFAQMNAQQAVEGVEGLGEELYQVGQGVNTLDDALNALKAGLNGNKDAMMDFTSFTISAKDEVSLLNSAQKELKDENNLSSATIKALNEKYADFISVTGLSKEKVLEFITAKKEERLEFFKTEISNTKVLIAETTKRLKAYEIEMKAIRKLNDAKAIQQAQAISDDVANGTISDLEAEKRIAAIRRTGNGASETASKLQEAGVQLNDLNEKLNILEGTQSNLIEQDKEETKVKEEKTKSTDKQVKSNDNLNATYTETIKILTETQKQLKAIEELQDKEERRRKRLKEGSDAYINSLQRENKERQKQIDLLKSASPEDLIAQEVTVTRKGENDSGSDYMGTTDRSSGLNSIVNEVTKLQGDFKYSQSRKSMGKSYDQFAKNATADCSEFVQRMFDEFLNIKLPSTTQTQVKEGSKVDKKDLQPGDLVFFNTDKKNGHVGIYMGDGKFSHMGNSGMTNTADINSDYWGSRYSTARRIQGANQSTVSVDNSNLTSQNTYNGKYSDLINKYSNEYGVDPKLIAAIAKTESEFNPNAKSKSGAQGLLQLMPDTAKGLGVTNSFDPEQNIKGGTRYFADLLKKYKGDVELALYAYNGGSGNVDKWIKSGQIKNIPKKETKNYAPKVLSAYEGLGGSLDSGLNTGQATKYKYKVISQDDIDASNEDKKQQIEAQEDKIYENNIKSIEESLKSYEKAYDKIGLAITASERKQSNFAVDSDEYRKEAQIQSKLISQQQQNLEKRNKRIDELVKKYNITSGEFDEVKDNNSMQWLEENDKKLEKSKIVVESYMTSYANKIDVLSVAMENSKNKLDMMTEGTAEYNNELNSQIPLIEQQNKQYESQLKYIQAQLQNKKLDADYRKELLESSKSITSSLQSNLKAVYDINEKMKELRKSAVDNIIDEYKSAIEKQKDFALEAVDKQKEAEEERHNQRTKNIEKESNQFKKYISDMIDQYNRANTTDDYEKDLTKSIKARDEIQNKIDVLSLDNSLSAKQKRADLQKQLDEQNESITTAQTQRERELRTQGWNDQLSDYEEYQTSIKDTEDTAYESTVKKLDAEKKKTEQTYTDMLNNEKKFYQLKQGLLSSDKNVVNSTIEEIKALYAGLFESMNGSTALTSQAFQNMAYTIENSLKNVTKYSKGDYSSKESTSNSELFNPSSTGTTSADKMASWNNYLANKKQAETIKKTMANLKTNSDQYKALNNQFTALKSKNDALRSKYNFPDMSYDVLSKLDTSQIASMDTGGYTGSFSGGKLLMAHEKELVLNKSDTSNALKIFELTASITDKIKGWSSGIFGTNNTENNNSTISNNNPVINIDMSGMIVKDGKEVISTLLKGLEARGMNTNIIGK